MFRVGIADEPKPEDPEFSDAQNAIDYASNWHWNLDHKEPIAVWEDNCFRWLFFQGEIFSRT